MTMPLLRAADPAAGVNPDPFSPEARGMLAGVLAESRPRMPRHRREAVRGLSVGGLVAAVAIAVFIGLGRGDGSHLGTAAYSVTRGADGSVRADIRWDEISDPAGLQAALDKAGARTKVFVVGPDQLVCGQPNTVSYSSRAVDWHIPNASGEQDGLVMRPRYFPANGTFVVVVQHAPHGSGSTDGPSATPIEGYATSMVIGPVSEPTC